MKKPLTPAMKISKFSADYTDNLVFYFFLDAGKTSCVVQKKTIPEERYLPTRKPYRSLKYKQRLLANKITTAVNEFLSLPTTYVDKGCGEHFKEGEVGVGYLTGCLKFGFEKYLRDECKLKAPKAYVQWIGKPVSITL